MENNTQMSNREILKDVIRKEEGFKDITYLDPDGVSKCIGYGHKLSDAQHPDELKVLGLDEDLHDWDGFRIVKDQAEELLDIDIDDAIESLEGTRKYQGFTEEELEALDPERYIAIISMAFQMGGTGVRQKYPSFVQAVKDKDWDRAADEMLYSNGLTQNRPSLWYIQTKKRCEKMAAKMRYGAAKVTDKPTVTAPESNTLDAFSDAELIQALYDRLVKGIPVGKD